MRTRQNRAIRAPRILPDRNKIFSQRIVKFKLRIKTLKKFIDSSDTWTGEIGDGKMKKRERYNFFFTYRYDKSFSYSSKIYFIYLIQWRL